MKKLYNFIFDNEKSSDGKVTLGMKEIFEVVFFIFISFVVGNLDLSPMIDVIINIMKTVYLGWFFYKLFLTKNGALIYLAFWFTFDAIKIYFTGL